MLKLVGILVLLILAVCIVAAVAFFYKNVHWMDKEQKILKRVGAEEKQVILPNGHLIHYGEVENDKPALLLIHGQMVSWEEYASLLPELSKNWHIYAVDVYGHGQSSHKEELYYLDVSGNDFIWYIDHVIGEKTVVSGHSNGALLAAYVGAYGSELVKGVVLEDPPVFSTQGEGWEKSFAYLDTYEPLHDYISGEQEECWEAYYLRHCLWGQLFMKNAMPGLADYAQHYHEKHPEEAVKIMFLPKSATAVFPYVKQYDMLYGEHFYNLTWNHGITHEQLLSDLKIPCVYLHAKESVSENGIYLCAASKEQADRAAALIGENCRLVETPDSDHNIHGKHTEIYVEAVNSFWGEKRMLSENMIMLRNLNGYSQEEVAEKIGISRQAYAKWEKGETIPDVERCLKLAELYGTSIDALMNFESRIGNTELTPGPKGKHIFGTVKINDRGQVVIPKEARELFHLEPGDSIVILGDEAEGIALVKAELFEQKLNQIMNMSKMPV